MSLDTRRPEAARPTRRRPPPRHRRRPTQRTYWRRRLVAIMVIVGLWLTWSLGSALLAPGTDSIMAKGAQWARLHYFGWAVTLAEKVQYEFTKPETGGSVEAIPTVTPVAPEPTPTPTAEVTPTLPPTSSAPGNIVPIAAGTVENEGLWQDLKTLPNGQVAIRGTYLRPDTEHTGYLAGIVWMDPKLARFSLHPGLKVPGDTGWAQDNQVPDSLRGSLLGTFNSGFMIVDAHGGYWQQGKQVGDPHQARRAWCSARTAPWMCAPGRAARRPGASPQCVRTSSSWSTTGRSPRQSPMPMSPPNGVPPWATQPSSGVRGGRAQRRHRRLCGW